MNDCMHASRRETGRRICSAETDSCRFRCLSDKIGTHAHPRNSKLADSCASWLGRFLSVQVIFARSIRFAGRPALGGFRRGGFFRPLIRSRRARSAGRFRRRCRVEDPDLAGRRPVRLQRRPVGSARSAPSACRSSRLFRRSGRFPRAMAGEEQGEAGAGRCLEESPPRPAGAWRERAGTWRTCKWISS